jgi:hypothetical protein
MMILTSEKGCKHGCTRQMDLITRKLSNDKLIFFPKNIGLTVKYLNI